MKKAARPGWEDYFKGIAVLISQRSTCLRRQVGAIIVKNRQMLATGYNGAPRGITHCEVTGCLRQQLRIPSGLRHEICRGLHAEQNAIIQAAYHGISIKGATLFCTTGPCAICAKMIINAGIKEVYHLGGYPDKLAKEMLGGAGIRLIKLSR